MWTDRRDGSVGFSSSSWLESPFLKRISVQSAEVVLAQLIATTGHGMQYSTNAMRFQIADSKNGMQPFSHLICLA
jgi:hypothetical protein